MRFAVSQFTTMPWSFEEDLDRYAALGVEELELCEEKLERGREIEQLGLLEVYGMRPSSVQPAVRTLFPSRMQPEPREIGERIERFKSTVELVAPFAPGAAFVCNTGPAPGGNVEAVIETTIREYRALAEFAAGYGVRVALEPLSPLLMNVESAIWTVGQAMRVIEGVGRRENFGLCLDLWNVWQGAAVEDEIFRAGERIFCVHVSDWRTPRSFEDRAVIGRGEIPFPPLLQAIHRSGFDGPYTLEIFSRNVPGALWEGDLEKVVIESRKALEKIWRESVVGRS